MIVTIKQRPFDPESTDPSELLLGPEYAIQMENWREHFIFQVAWNLTDSFDELRKIKWRLRFYFKVGPINPAKASDYWVVAPLWVFVMAKQKAIRAWYGLARYCYKKGWLKITPTEGEAISWWWVKHLFIK